MNYLENAFITGSGGSIGLSDNVRKLLGEHIIVEDVDKAYETNRGTAYSGRIVIRCAKSDLKDDSGRTVWVTPNGVKFVYIYREGNACCVDGGSIKLYSPICKIKGRQLSLDADGKVVVPVGMIAVNCWSCYIRGYGNEINFKTYPAGVKVDPKYDFLDNGEETKVSSTNRYGERSDYRVYNNNGKPEVSVHPDEIAAKKQFASNQYNTLVEMGFGKKISAAIMKAAGPGMCVAAANWAIYAVETNGHADLLDCVLYGAGGTHSFGRDRMADVISALGLEPPQASSSSAFYKVLAGARIAIVAGVPAKPTHNF